MLCWVFWDFSQNDKEHTPQGFVLLTILLISNGPRLRRVNNDKNKNKT